MAHVIERGLPFSLTLSGNYSMVSKSWPVVYFRKFILNAWYSYFIDVNFVQWLTNHMSYKLYCHS